MYSLIQRQGRLYLLTQGQQLPGNKGPTAIPTAAVVWTLFAQVALVQFWIGKHEVVPVSGVQPHHLLICDALGLDHSWYAALLVHDIDQFSQTPLNVGCTRTPYLKAAGHMKCHRGRPMLNRAALAPVGVYRSFFRGSVLQAMP